MKTSKTVSGVRGQKIMSATGRDDSGDVGLNEKESREGRVMGGGVDNLAHSLSGTSAEQDVTAQDIKGK